jgi:hypothetical protein
MTNTSYARLPEALTYGNYLRSPYSVEINPLSMGEVLALGLITPPTTSLRQGVWFDEVVTRLLGLPGPIKSDMWSVHNSRLAIGAKMMWSLTDMDGGYHIKISE